MMHVSKRNRFYWIMMDAPTKRQATVHVEVEYDVLDRQFHASFRRRQTTSQGWPKWRPATPHELDIAKAQLAAEELAACLAESINPNPWTTAAKQGAKALATRHVLRGAKLFIDGQEMPVLEVQPPHLP